MFRRFYDWLVWKLNHVHEMECHGYDESVTPSSERFYWHRHECRWCDHTESVMATTPCGAPDA